MGGEGSQNRVLCSGWRLLSRARRESRGQGGRLFAPPLFLGRGKEEDTRYEDEGVCVATFFFFYSSCRLSSVREPQLPTQPPGRVNLPAGVFTCVSLLAAA